MSLASAFFPFVKMFLQATGALYAARCAHHYSPGTRVRRAWTLMSLGPACWLFAQLSAALYSLVLQRRAPVPSFHDLFIFAGGACVIAACVSFRRIYRESGFAVDGGPKDTLFLAGISVPLAVVGYVIVSNIWSTPEGTLEHVVDTCYPALDLAMLATVLLLLRTALRFVGGRVWHVWAAILAGLACATTGDMLFSLSAISDLPIADVLANLSLITCYGLVALGVRIQYRMVSS